MSVNEISRMNTQCLKITEKVSFNIASEASYVYILGQTVLPDMLVLKGQIVEKCQNSKIQMRHFE